jgi:hypothetical protein
MYDPQKVNFSGRIKSKLVTKFKIFAIPPVFQNMSVSRFSMDGVTSDIKRAEFDS